MAFILHFPEALSKVTESLMPFLHPVKLAIDRTPNMVQIASKFLFTEIQNLPV